MIYCPNGISQDACISLMALGSRDTVDAEPPKSFEEKRKGLHPGVVNENDIFAALHKARRENTSALLMLDATSLAHVCGMDWAHLRQLACFASETWHQA